jgi:hypothetical protein
MILFQRVAFGMTRAIAIAVFSSAICLPLIARADDEPAPPKARFFELRIYTAHDGKLEALHQRFRDHTNRLFQKHGMQLVGYWTPAEGPEAENTLIYVLAYESRAARDKAWEAFKNDPDWIKAYEQSHKDGPLVKKVESKFMNSTDYSPIR